MSDNIEFTQAKLSVLLFSTNTSRSTLRTQLQGSAHIVVDFPGLCTHNCRASTYYPPLDSDIQMLSNYLLQEPITFHPSKNCLSLIELCSIYTLPWPTILAWADSIYINFYYFQVDYPLTESIVLYAPHTSKFLQYFNPTSWAFYPKTVMWDLHYPTVPQHNHCDLSRVTRWHGQPLCLGFMVFLPLSGARCPAAPFFSSTMLLPSSASVFLPLPTTNNVDSSLFG